MKGLTKKFLEDPIGSMLLLVVVLMTAAREGEIIPTPWDKVAGTLIMLLFTYGIVTRPPKKS